MVTRGKCIPKFSNHLSMYKFEISDIRDEPNNNRTITFRDLSGGYPEYKAGQFLTLVLFFGDREVRRSYSFSSSPAADEVPAITVKRVDNGEVSRFLHHKAKVGDVLDVLGPQGLFFYEPRSESERTVFLFAAGVGATPLYSILKTALVSEKRSKVVLVYSNRSPERTLFYQELGQWQAQYPERLAIVWLFSNSKDLTQARLNREYLIRIVQAHLPEHKNAVFYTCGPVFYMDLVRFTLPGMGIPESDIRRETFHVPEAEDDEEEREEKPVDTRSYTVRLRFEGQTHDLTVPYDKTVLEVALEHKIRLPYSCKSGMCSTCASLCVSGAVRMDYNEVLTDREVANGRCLLCVSHPVAEGTEIEVG